VRSLRRESRDVALAGRLRTCAEVNEERLEALPPLRREAVAGTRRTRERLRAKSIEVQES